MKKNNQRENGEFRFLDTGEVSLRERRGSQTREPWLMLMARRGRPPLETLCWGLTNAGSAFARIGTQEGDMVNGFVHEDPYKTRLLGPYVWFTEETGESGDSREDRSGAFTNAWYPLLRQDQELETVYSFGTLTTRTACRGLSVTTEVFIPESVDALVQLVTVKNESPRPRSQKLFNAWPVNLGDARDIQFSGFNTLMMGGGRFDPDLKALAWRTHYGIPLGGNPEVLKGMFGRVLLHTSSLEGLQWSAKYEDFYGHWSGGPVPEGFSAPLPEALRRGSLPGVPAEELTSALSCLMGTLELRPGEERKIVFALTAADAEDYYARSGEGIRPALRSLRNPAEAERLLAETRSCWKGELDAMGFAVSGDDVLTHSEKWLRYQCAMVASLNRMKSRYHSGFEYGYGFRDILQDLLALLPTDPRRAAEALELTARQMFADGSVYHNFFASARGNRNFHACDDPLWFAFALCEYVRETGDFAFAGKVLPFADEKEGLPPREGSLLERALLAAERVWGRSEEGLPVLYDADWNDDLGGYPSHLSVMTAQMLYKACLDLAELLERGELPERDADAAAGLRERARVIRKSFAERAIDPEGRFIRLVSPDPVHAPHLGSSDSDGLTFFEPVAWAGMSGIASREEFLAASAHAERDLEDRFGFAICPADRNLAEGRLPEDFAAWKRNAPGKKENGGEFRHLESWYIASLCAYGLGRRACGLFRRTLPAVCSADDPWTYGAERFVFPEYVSGPGSAEHGRAGHTWLTGTAPTRLRALYDWILGLMPRYDGLGINPCVDPGWKRFEARRPFRGTDFRFLFENPEGVETGVLSVTVDGEELQPQETAPGTLSPAPAFIVPLRLCGGGSRTVRVLMGARK